MRLLPSLFPGRSAAHVDKAETVVVVPTARQGPSDFTVFMEEPTEAIPRFTVFMEEGPRLFTVFMNEPRPNLIAHSNGFSSGHN